MKQFLAPFPNYQQKKKVKFDPDNLESVPETRNVPIKYPTPILVQLPSKTSTQDVVYNSDSSLTPDFETEWLSSENKGRQCSQITQQTQSEQSPRRPSSNTIVERCVEYLGRSPYFELQEADSTADAPPDGCRIPVDPEVEETQPENLDSEAVGITVGERPGQKSISDDSVSDDEGLHILNLPTSLERENEDTSKMKISPENLIVEETETVVNEDSSAESIPDSAISKKELVLPIRKRVRVVPLHILRVNKPSTSRAASIAHTSNTHKNSGVSSDRRGVVSTAEQRQQEPVKEAARISVDEPRTDRNVPVCNTHSQFPRKRREYMYEEKKRIVDYISQTQAHNKVKGREFWQRMEAQQVCPGRTWQSLKEHYIKQIIPNLNIFHLPKDEENRFLAPFL